MFKLHECADVPRDFPDCSSFEPSSVTAMARKFYIAVEAFDGRLAGEVGHAGQDAIRARCTALLTHRPKIPKQMAVACLEEYEMAATH